MGEDGPQQEKGEFPAVGEGGVTSQELLPQVSIQYVHTGAAAAELRTQHCWREDSVGVTSSPVNLLCSSAWGKGQDHLQKAKMSLHPGALGLAVESGRGDQISRRSSK